jgi:hypothetical protein
MEELEKKKLFSSFWVVFFLMVLKRETDVGADTRARPRSW